MSSNTPPLPKTGTSSNGGLLHYSVGAILEDPQGRLFLMDRKFEPYGWAGFAGHIDVGEEPLVALLREGQEELHTELKDVQLVHQEEVLWNHCYRAPSHYWYLYRAVVDPSLVRVDPHEVKVVGKGERPPFGWFTREEILTMNLEPIWRKWFIMAGYLPS